MIWSRSETLGLAQQTCTQCYGLGLRDSGHGASTPCDCVFRAIFRACYNRFRECANRQHRVSNVSLEYIPGRKNKAVYSRKDEEFVADFCLISKRVLSEADHKIFRFYFLLGAGWKLCCRRLNMDRGNFYHQVYRIQERLGRVFAEVEPYALFPVDEYFGGNRRRRAGVSGFVQTAEHETGKLVPFSVKKVA
jgi:hypothetical protein